MQILEITTPLNRVHYQKISTIIMSGCVCHILHNATCKAGSFFSDITLFNIEDHCINLYHWLDKSSKRKNVLSEYFEFCDMEHSEVIKFVSTRWLSLELCVSRETKKYEGLKSYFLLQETRGKRFQRLHEAFINPMLEVYLLFYQPASSCFIAFNLFLQREQLLIYFP